MFGTSASSKLAGRSAYALQPLEPRLLFDTAAGPESMFIRPTAPMSAVVAAPTAPTNVGLASANKLVSPDQFQTYTATYSDADENIKVAFIRFINQRTGKVFEAAYSVSKNLLLILNSAENGYSVGARPGTSDFSYASQTGVLDVEHTTIQTSDGAVTVNFRIALTEQMDGVNPIYARVRDLTGLEDSYENLGGVSVRVGAPPRNVSISPAQVVTTYGTFHTVTATYSDADDNFKTAFLRYQFDRNKDAKIDFVYDAELDRFRIRDTSPAPVSADRKTPGVILKTPLGALDIDNTTVTRENGTLTIGFRILVNAVDARASAYLHVIDSDGFQDDYENFDDAYWFIPNTRPVNVSLSPADPSSVAGTYRTFTATYRDAEQNIILAALRFTNPSGSIFEAQLQYPNSPTSPQMFVRGVSTPQKPGAPGATISVPTGTLDVEHSSFVFNGSTLTVNFRIALTSMMSGVNVAYLRVRDAIQFDTIQDRVNNASWTIMNPSIFSTERFPSSDDEWQDLY